MGGSLSHQLETDFQAESFESVNGEDNNGIGVEPLQMCMILMLFRLSAVMWRGLKCELIKYQFEEALVLQDQQKFNDRMRSLRNKLDGYFQSEDGQSRFKEDEADVRSKHSDMQRELIEISQRHEAIGAQLQVLQPIESCLMQLATNLRFKMSQCLVDFMPNIDVDVNMNKIPNTKSIIDNSGKIRNLIIGYIRQEIEMKYDMVIPSDV